MRIFVAGATGAIGRRLLPLLAQHGHEVTGMTHSRDKARLLYELGAAPAVADGLDRDAVIAAVERAEPEVVIHQMTSLADATSLRRFDAAFALTNRLRTEGTDHLLAAARRAQARRFVAQSFGNWNYERTGGAAKTEEDPFDPSPPRSMRRSLAAIVHLETAVARAEGLEGIALRYANLYGPGTGTSLSGQIVHMLRERQLPVIGGGGGVWSFVHVDDAALATVAAVERGEPGVYNVADDWPVEAAVWVPELAKIVGAEPPRHVPTWIGRLAAGEAVVSMFTRTRGAVNAKARHVLGWRPRYSTWQLGFREGLSEAPRHPRPVYSSSFTSQR
jgi:nucleoside-diphosphate-sugar epimerase